MNITNFVNKYLAALSAQREERANMNYYRVMFIGSGYEVVFEIEVYAATYDKAFEIAEKMYDDNNWSFHYCHTEAEII
ncbi:MAG: hypothetical protein IJJ57_01000 [Ruminococcus sp.]|nr:hypothetical protein [Ruminococcus sp.]